MKAMRKTLLCLSLASTMLFAAPKPLLNPFADTMSNSATAPSSSGGLPTQSVASVSAASGDISMMDSQPEPLETMQALPTMQTIAQSQPRILSQTSTTRLVVKGQGVAPSFTQSPAQAFALAKRAAMVDAYRLLGEKIQGVKVEGQDLIKNMMVKRSQVRTEVNAMIREATVIETEFKDGLCEVEVELIVTGARWHGTLSHAFAE
jgi:outer membrane protein FlgP